LKKKKYYVCAEISYSFLRQRHQIIADSFDKTFDVTFVERIPSRFPSDIPVRVVRKLANVIGKGSGAKNGEHAPIKLSRSLMLPEINTVFRQYNSKRVRSLLREASTGDIIHLFANNPSIAKEAKARGCTLVFDIVHNWWSFPYHREHQLENLESVLRLADVIVSDSRQTLDLAKNQCGAVSKRFLLMPPGVDEIWFDPEEPHPPSAAHRYRIGFFGNLRANSDIKLFASLEKFQATEIQIFGLLDHSLSRSDTELLRRYHKGTYAVNELVSKLKEVDAILLPYDTSNFSTSIFPAKYFEAMALGKPIISNSNMNHLPCWGELIWTSDQLESMGWESLLTEHYASRHRRQIMLARENSWEQRTRILRNALNDEL